MKFQLLTVLLALGAPVTGRGTETPSGPDGISTLPKVTVEETRLESFGFDVILESALTARYPYVTKVLPNTAASKAGLRPGDRILKSNGKSAGVTAFTVGSWFPKMPGGGRAMKGEKIAEDAARAGERTIVWTLEVETRGLKESRTLKLVLPTPPPRWGSPNWQLPEGRPPTKVVETGPLAERCREVLDNGVWSSPGENTGTRLLVTEPDPARFHFLGYHWEIKSGGTTHIIFVTQHRGRTEVLLTKRDDHEMHFYLTTPAATLENSDHWGGPKTKTKAEATERIRAGFEAEVEFWLKKVRRGTGPWPFELAPDGSK